MNHRTKSALLPRRKTLAILGGAGVYALTSGSSIAAAQSISCLLAPEMTEGPYWVDEKLNRSDIRSDPSDGTVKSGVPLTLSITVHDTANAACSLLSGAYVDIWHCDSGGLYSDEAANGTVGKKFLRGFQVTDNRGAVQFTTIYPGWYSGRTVHIHIRIRTYSGSQVLGQFTSQFFFDDSLTDQVFGQDPYSSRRTRDTRNAADMVYQGAANASRMLLTVTQTAQGYAASIDVSVNLQAGTPVTTAFALPQVAYGGGWDTALYFSNTTDLETSAQVNFVASDGAAMSVPVAGVGMVSTQTIDLTPRSTVMLEFQNIGELSQGWAEALLPSGVIGYAVFRQSAQGRADQEAVVPLSLESSQAAELVYDNAAHTTAVALVNPSNQATTVTVAAYRNDGAVIGSSSVNIGARSRTSVLLRDLPGLAGVSGTRGWVAFSVSNGAVAALGLRAGNEAFTSVPVTQQ